MPPDSDHASPAADAGRSAVARALRALGRDDAGPRRRIALLTVLHGACEAGWALALTQVLIQAAAPWSLLALAAATGARAWVSRANSRAAARHAFRIKSRLRRQAATTVLGHAAPRGAAIGTTLAAVVDEIEALDGYFSQYCPARLDARIGPLLIAAAMAPASPVAATILLATLLPFAAVMALAGGAASMEATRQFDALARLSGHFVDRVRALPVILAFQAEAAETARVAAAAGEVSRRTLNVLRIAFISSAALEFFSAISVAIVAVYCGFALLGLLPFKPLETLDFPAAFYALTLAPQFYAPLRRLAGAYHEKQLGEAAAARLLPLLHTPPGNDAMPAVATAGDTAITAAAQPDTATAIRDAHARCSSLRRISSPDMRAPAVHCHAALIGSGDLAIGPIDLEAPAGALTVITGPTGSGKSTLLAALAGRIPIRSGTIAISGPGPDQTFPQADTPHHFSWAGQAPVFLPGTILENLMSAAPGVTRQAALAMALRVGLEPALRRRPNGGDTMLDERGSGLSGGERRRLALGRALLKPAPLLLLDEPTAELDSASRNQIIQLIREAACGRTIIAATHCDALAAVAAHSVRLA